MAYHEKTPSPGLRASGLILGPRPNECSCSWAVTRVSGKDVMYLKVFNAMCRIRHIRQAV